MNPTRRLDLSIQGVVAPALLAVAVLLVGAMIGATFRVADSSTAIAEFGALRSDAWQLTVAASSSAATTSDINAIVNRAELRAAAADGAMRNVAPAHAAASLASLQLAWGTLVETTRGVHAGNGDPTEVEAAAERMASSVDDAIALATTANVQSMRALAVGLRIAIAVLALAACAGAWVAARRVRFILANIDPSTGLFTLRRGHRAIERLLHSNVPVALLAIRLDDLANVEETLGSEARARVLTQAAQRLELLGVAKGDIAVCSNNTLVVVFAGLGRLRALARSELMLKSLARPLSLGDTSLPMTIAMGLACAPEDGSTPPQLVNAAIRASSRSSKPAAGPVAMFKRELDGDGGLALDQALQRAVDTREFEVHYQPIIDLRTGMPVGAEALLAWPGPEAGWRSPEVFVHELERLGLMSRVTRDVISRAVKDALSWPSIGREQPLGLAVNLSPSDLFDPEVARAIGRARVETAQVDIQLEVEISERVVLDPAGDVVRAVARLRATGARVALDDFGVEQSTLAHVQQLRPDTVKIDRALIAQVVEDVGARELVRAAIDAVHALGSVVIAEGVECESQAQALRTMNCDYAQGYYFGRKMPLSEFNAFVAEWTRTARLRGQVLAA